MTAAALAGAPLLLVPLAFAQELVGGGSSEPAAAPTAAPAPALAPPVASPAPPPLPAAASAPAPAAPLSPTPRPAATPVQRPPAALRTAESDPLLAPAEIRRAESPRRFDADIDALVRDGVVSPRERVRVRGTIPGLPSPAVQTACRNGALTARECGGGITVIGRSRRDGLSGPLGDPGLAGSSGYAGAGFAAEGSGFRTDAAPLAPIAVPVTALLSGAGGSFRLTDVFGRTPRPAAVAGNGNLRLLYPLIGSSVPTSGFGWRLHPVLGSWLMHAGKDLAAAEGTPVVAALSGRVVSSGLAGGYGLAIEIEHEGPRRRTLYGHLSELYVREGQQVRQGEVIGRVGSTGLSTGPHLHFELRAPQDGGWVAVDPGDLDPGTGLPAGSAIAGLGGLRAPGDGPMPDAVALLMGQLIQTLERPRSPLAPSPSAQPLPPTQALPAPAPLPAPRQG
ncbi:MAG: M23 family metallopeptidase [Synechococcaceae cyanobacterium]|nr:M23 family metallopeptidase [Synechococcaceae cyanobacterium]